MRAELVFKWTGGRPDDHAAVLIETVAQRVLHDGVWFGLHDWDIRYAGGGSRVTHLVYSEGDRPPAPC